MGPKVGIWWCDSLFWGWKAHGIGRPNIPGRRDPSLKDGNVPTPLGHAGASFLFLGLPPLFGWSLLLFIPLFRSSSSYTCQSSIPILKCTSLQPFFLALCELLWPPSPCPGVTSTSKEIISCVYLIRRWQLFLGRPPHHSPMASPYGLEPLLRSSSGCPRVTWRFFFPMILACRGRHSGNLDSLHSSLGTFSSSAWALGLRWNGPKPLGPSGPTDTIYKTIYVVY